MHQKYPQSVSCLLSTAPAEKHFHRVKMCLVCSIFFFFLPNKLKQSRQADGAKFTPVITSKGLTRCHKSRLMFSLFNVNALKTGITVACTVEPG